MSKQEITITSGSEIVFSGSRELTIKDNILSFNDDRFHYWQYSEYLLKFRIGTEPEDVIKYGHYTDKRTQGQTVNFKLIS